MTGTPGKGTPAGGDGTPLPAAYRREVALFTDWATATGKLPAIPATWDTVQEFLDAAGGPEATRRVRAAAIAAAHRAAGLQPPERPPRPPAPPARPDVADLLVALPQWGWPAALFARRDALLITLWAAGATPARLAELTAADITVTTQRHLCVAGLPALPATESPDTCPACIWLRWKPLQQRITDLTTARRLRDTLSTRGPDQPDRDLQHRCTHPVGHNPADSPGDAPGGYATDSIAGSPAEALADPLTDSAADLPAAGPLFPPLDRWGNTPAPTPAATGRGLRGIVAAHRDNRSPTRLAALTPPQLSEPEPPPAPSPPALDPNTHQRGLAARNAALADLNTATDQLGDLSEVADRLAERIEQLLAIATSSTIWSPLGSGDGVPAGTSH